MPPPASPQPTHPPLCGSLVIAGYEIIFSKYGKCYWSVVTPIFREKRASSSQDTVDYIVQRAARKNSLGNPGLTHTSHVIIHTVHTQRSPQSQHKKPVKPCQAVLTLSQLLMFNSFALLATKLSTHNYEREPPLPLYLRVLMYAKTRKRELVDALFELGLSISYDRLLNISAVMCNTLCKQFEMEKVVCPPKLRLELFTTAAIDNIDHNPSSTSPKGSFHGTSIAVFQHFKMSLMEWSALL